MTPKERQKVQQLQRQLVGEVQLADKLYNEVTDERKGECQGNREKCSVAERRRVPVLGGIAR